MIAEKLEPNNDEFGEWFSDEVLWVEVKRLSKHPLNKAYFNDKIPEQKKTEPGKQGNHRWRKADLESNIGMVGIHTPLIVNADFRVLDGNNRLSIAQKLNIEKVPCRFAKRMLTDEECRYVIVTTQILRRQTTGGQLKALRQEADKILEKMYPNYEDLLLENKLTNDDISKITGMSPSQAKRYGIEKRKIAKVRETRLRNETEMKSAKVDPGIVKSVRHRIATLKTTLASATLETVLEVKGDIIGLSDFAERITEQ